ncbi:nucleoprotein TPR [Ditylenchus destructor]|nr:nucleoprotein TPR [Ditylenchus destructor]
MSQDGGALDMETSISDPVNDAPHIVADQRKIAQLEQEIFSVTKQLDESKEQVVECKKQNSLLHDRLNTLETEKSERNKFVEELEKQRQELGAEKTELENAKTLLQSQKDSFEQESAKLLTEKRHLTDELVAVRTECVAARKEQCLLQMKIDEFNTEKNLIAYDKERWTREKEILVQGKQWCMNEISNREMKLNELRIQMMQIETKMQREKFMLSQEKDALAAKVDELNEELTKKDKEMTEISDHLQQIVEERATTMNEMDAELRTKERLTDVYKQSLEATNSQLSELKESEAKLQATLQDYEINVVNLNAELEKMKEEHNTDAAEKDSKIKKMEDELAKSNDLLKLGARGHRSDDEIAALSPAAAAASNLLKSGVSLTSIYAEHCRVVAELEKKKDENVQIERYVQELIEELDAKAPLFKQQSEVYESALEEIEQLRLQTSLLAEDRQKLQNSRDAATRELSFTKAELERYQHEHHILSAQVRRLIFSIEKGRHESLGDDESEEYLFHNIQELQQKNMELTSRLHQLEEEQQEALKNYYNAEKEALTNSLKAAENELERIRQHKSKLELLVEELTAQRDNYKALYEENTSRTVSPPTSAAGLNDRQNLDKTHSDLANWKHKSEFLQEKLEAFASDRQNVERSLNDRIDTQMDVISQLRTTNGKLESSLEFQKSNQQLMSKQVGDLEKELKKANDATAKVTLRLEAIQTKYDELINQLMQRQQELSHLKVQNHSLEEQLNVSRSNEQRTITELGILRQTQFNTERVALTLQEVENVLKRVDAEKQSSMISQLQSACLERDNLKSLVDNLNRQNTQLTNNLKLSLNTITGERDRAFLEIKSLQDKALSIENSYKELKEEHDKLVNESVALQSSDSDIDACKKEIQQLKNRTAYQEKQISELEVKNEELSQAVTRKENELLQVSALSGNMETTIREQTEITHLERQRLEARCKQFEQDLSSSKFLIEELRNNIANLEYKIMEKDRAVELSESRFQDAESRHQQQRLEMEEEQRKNQEAFTQLQTVIDVVQAEFENHKISSSNLASDNAQLNESLLSEKAKSEDLSKQVAQLTEQLNMETGKLKAQVELLEQEKLRFLQEISDFNERDQDNLQRTNTFYDQIQKLVEKIAFMEQMQCVMPDSANTSLNQSNMSLTEESDAHSASTLNTIIGYMRIEKQKETELRMNAELDLQRERAKSSIEQEKIRSIEAELISLRNTAQANAQAALENEKLLSELNALRDSQQRHADLKKDYDEVQSKFAAMEKKAKELANAFSQARTAKANFEGRLNATQAELEARKKENQALRERNEGEFEKQKQLLNQHTNELEILKGQLNKCTTELSARNKEFDEKTKQLERATQMLAQAKQLARNYRDSSNTHEKTIQQLQAEIKKHKEEMAATKTKQAEPATSGLLASFGGASAIAGAANTKKILQDKCRELEQAILEKQALASQVEALEKEKIELATKLAAQTVELDEANEKIEAMTQDLNKRDAEIGELKQQLTDASANLPTVTSGNISRKRNLISDEPPKSETVSSMEPSLVLEEAGMKRSRLNPETSDAQEQPPLLSVESALLDLDAATPSAVDVTSANQDLLLAQSPVNIADQENVTETAQQQERAQLEEPDDKIQGGQAAEDSLFIEEGDEVTEGGHEQQPQSHEHMGEVEPEGEMSYHGHDTDYNLPDETVTDLHQDILSSSGIEMPQDEAEQPTEITEGQEDLHLDLVGEEGQVNSGAEEASEEQIQDEEDVEDLENIEYAQEAIENYEMDEDEENYEDEFEDEEFDENEEYVGEGDKQNDSDGDSDIICLDEEEPISAPATATSSQQPAAQETTPAIPFEDAPKSAEVRPEDEPEPEL